MTPLFPSPYPIESTEQQYSRVMLGRYYGKKYKPWDKRDFVFELSEISGLSFADISEQAEEYVAEGCGIAG